MCLQLSRKLSVSETRLGFFHAIRAELFKRRFPNYKFPLLLGVNQQPLLQHPLQLQLQLPPLAALPPPAQWAPCPASRRFPGRDSQQTPWLLSQRSCAHCCGASLRR